MTFYRFKTFTTSYYFPQLGKSQRFMYGLYSPYGGVLSRVYWWLFRQSGLVRWATRIEEESMPFPYEAIRLMDGTDAKMAFNMGSPGVEQKISILGIDNNSGGRFFAKYSQKEKAKALTRHEAHIYKILRETHLTPQLLSFAENEMGVYMKVEYIHGSRPKTMKLTDEIVQKALLLSRYHLEETASGGSKKMKTCLSHGDFCPWNFLVIKDKYKLIDWELTAERPLGYDIFTYICNVSALFHPEKSLSAAIDENRERISAYFKKFGIDDFNPYLKDFAKEKFLYEMGKNNNTLSAPYKRLFESL